MSIMGASVMLGENADKDTNKRTSKKVGKVNGEEISA
jgi:hypothetical protein